MCMPTKKQKPSGTAQVVSFLQSTPHPLKEVMEMLRNLILSLEEPMQENIKWNAPNFTHQNQDRFTMNVAKPDKILLVMHGGAKTGMRVDKEAVQPGSTNFKWSSSADRATLAFHSPAEVQQQEEEIKQVLLSWLRATTA